MSEWFSLTFSGCFGARGPQPGRLGSSSGARRSLGARASGRLPRSVLALPDFLLPIQLTGPTLSLGSRGAQPSPASRVLRKAFGRPTEGRAGRERGPTDPEETAETGRSWQKGGGLGNLGHPLRCLPFRSGVERCGFHMCCLVLFIFVGCKEKRNLLTCQGQGVRRRRRKFKLHCSHCPVQVALQPCRLHEAGSFPLGKLCA